MMNLHNFHLEYTFAGDRVEELNRKLSLLITTPLGAMPMEREFGMTQDFLDRPSEAAKALFTAELTEKAALFLPEARIASVQWISEDGGQIIPKVVVADG